MTVGAIDLLEFRHSAEMHFNDTVSFFLDAVKDVDMLDVACVVVGVAVFSAVYNYHRRWVKGKGLRMAVDQERHRVREMLSEGLTDMILQWEVDGKLSHQQGDKLYTELSKKLDLPGLIPPQRRVKIVKNEIKTRLRSPKHKINPKIPGGKPEPIVRKKFRQTAGYIQKFWKVS